MNSRLILPLVALSLVLAGSSACLGRPAHKRALVEYLGTRLDVRLNDCRTCHLPAEAGSDPAIDDRPHNLFGKRLAAIRTELKAQGKKTGVIDRIEAIGDEDSDGDGASNLLELVTGHHPGDAADRPLPSDRKRDLAVLAAFRAGKVEERWSPFEPVTRPAVPILQGSHWARNPIDHFIAAQSETKGIAHRPEADRATLIRRVTLDLTGLPPTPAELDAYMSDQDGDAYEKMVDRLLLSPLYGERWGRHWMDIWRYSDWAGWGTQVRDSQPHIWHWRDWIIESLNKDKGYDRMVVEMLAADEAAPGDLDALRATGYLARNYKLLSREKWMQDTVDHTSMAFLGITAGCAKCHDHMYDPIAQKEYYRLRAIFTPHQVRMDRVPGETDTEKNGLPIVYDADLNAQTFLFVRGDDRTPSKDALPPGVPEFLGGTFEVKPVALPMEAYAPHSRAFMAEDELNEARDVVNKSRTARDGADRKLAVELSPFIPRFRDRSILKGQPTLSSLSDASMRAAADLEIASAMQAELMAVLRAEQVELSAKPGSPELQSAAQSAAKAQRLAALAEARKKSLEAEIGRRTSAPGKRAQADQAHAKAEKARLAAEALAAQPADAKYAKRAIPAYPRTSTGRRLAFAQWVTSRGNPLAARVAVNHVWMRHFGQAIVPSVFDFGKNGRKPTHPQLLDWLASEFVDRGWSMKSLHRLIVTSATYRQASTPAAPALAQDPDNLTYWRFAPRRLEAEAVRDAMLALGGSLDRTMGGADIDQNLGMTVPRRSLYFRHAAEKQMTFLTLFDAASVTECYERRPSVLPQQALALANSDLALRMARRLARRLDKAAGADASAFVATAFENVIGRQPTSAEREACLTFLAQRSRAVPVEGPTSDTDEKQPAAAPALRARENLVHVLFNHHEFVTIR